MVALIGLDVGHSVYVKTRGGKRLTKSQPLETSAAQDPESPPEPPPAENNNEEDDND